MAQTVPSGELSPAIQAGFDLHFGQTRSPGQALGKASRHMRHGRLRLFFRRRVAVLVVSPVGFGIKTGVEISDAGAKCKLGMGQHRRHDAPPEGSACGFLAQSNSVTAYTGNRIRDHAARDASSRNRSFRRRVQGARRRVGTAAPACRIWTVE